MSMIATPAPVPATIPATVAKTFGASVPALVARVVPVTVPDLDLFKPSDIRMSDSAARAAMNAKLDKGEQAHAFVQGFVFLAVRLAWGSIKLDSALQGQTKYGEFALRKFHASLTGTSGITAGLLRMATESALSDMLALPAPAKKAKSVPAPVAISAPAPDVEAVAAHAFAQGQAAIAANEAAHETAWAEYGDTLAKAMKEARETVVALTVKHATLADQVRDEVASMPDDSRLQLLQELAHAYGFRLSRAPAKKSA